MSQHIIKAVSRELGTKGDLNSLRKNGGIPAVMYNRKGECLHISLNDIEFSKAILGATESTIVELNLDGKNHNCLIKDRQIDWLHDKVQHVDFFEVEEDQTIRAKVSIHLTGTPVGVRLGGVLENPVHEIEVESLPKDMPNKFVIDVSELEANHSVHVRDIPVASGVKLLSNPDKVVAIVKFIKEEVVEAPTTEAAEGEATAAAAPAAADATAAPAK